MGVEEGWGLMDDLLGGLGCLDVEGLMKVFILVCVRGLV